MTFDWNTQVPLSADVREARERAKTMQDIWNEARKSIEKAQEWQKAQTDKYRREDDFEEFVVE